MNPHFIILILLAAAFIPEIVYIFKLFKEKSTIVKQAKITLRVNAIIFGMALILLGIVVSYDINYLKYKAPIEYSNWKEIDWSDFRAIKRPKQTLHGSQNFAFICTEIAYEFNDGMLEIKTLFHPSRSYTFSEEVAGENLLLHELYHLHITEYCSRMLRKNVTNLKNQPDNIEISGLILEYQQKEREMQYQYDDETYHGYVLGKQRNWQGRIDSCLTSLATYSVTVINYEE